MMKNRWLSLLLCVLVLTAPRITAAAAARDSGIVASGGSMIGDEFRKWWSIQENPDVFWTLYDDGTLSITGKGTTTDIPYMYGGDYVKFNQAAYYNIFFQQFKDAVCRVEIGEGITRIGDGLFTGCENLESVSFPKSLKEIGRHAFCGCKNLKNITIPDSIQTIENGAFMESGLETITVPDSVTVIKDVAFYDCANLKTIVMPTHLVELGRHVFHGTEWFASQPDGSVFLNDCYYAYKGEFEWDKEIEIHIPEGTRSVAGGAFYCECRDNIKKVSMPDSVVYIGDQAFYACFYLKSVRLSRRITTIPYGLFDGCSALTKLQLPDGLTKIGEIAFANCSALQELRLPGSVTEIAGGAFLGCKSLSLFVLPDGVKTIEWGTFSGCNSLSQIVLPAGLKKIGNNAFNSCTALTDVYYGGSAWRWSRIPIGEYNNDELLKATIHCVDLPADVDGDGKVTSADARLALRASVGLEQYVSDSPEFIAADVNGDGKIGPDDARLILRMSVGLEPIQSAGIAV